MTKREVVAAWARFYTWRSELDRLDRLWRSGLVTWDQFIGSMGG
jgi:hypothetical protein